MTRIIFALFVLTTTFVNPVSAADLAAADERNEVNTNDYLFPVALDIEVKAVLRNIQRIDQVTVTMDAKQDFNNAQALEIVNVLENLKQEQQSYLVTHLQDTVGSITK